MDIGQLLSSINIFAFIALVVVLFILLLQLKPIFFHKKVSKNPVIPDFDGNIHTLPDDHATHINVEEIEHDGGVNVVLIVLLFVIFAVLLVIVLGGLYFGKRPKSVPIKNNFPTSTIIPTEVIEIGEISPTSPFEESQEVPFDLSGTPIAETLTPIVSPTVSSIEGPTSIVMSGSPTSAPGYTKSPTMTGTTSSVTISPTPTLPVAGDYKIFILLTAIPIALLTIAILL